MLHRFIFVAVLVSACVAVALRAEDILVVEQDYNIVQQGNSGPEAKDVRQKLYISKDRVAIDEFGGKNASEQPTETILVNLKKKEIVNQDHENKRKVTETFDARRKNIEERQKHVEEDLAAMPPGPQKDKIAKLYRAMLDDKRKFALAKDPGPTAKLLDLDCQPVKVIAEETPDYVPMSAFLHPDLELPYDNAEVLYLLKIIGKHMAGFLKDNKSAFKNVPLELHLDLAAGGRLDTKVIRVSKLENPEFAKDFRGGLGSPFETPADYQERVRPMPPKPEETRPD